MKLSKVPHLGATQESGVVFGHALPSEDIGALLFQGIEVALQSAGIQLVFSLVEEAAQNMLVVSYGQTKGTKDGSVPGNVRLFYA